MTLQIEHMCEDCVHEPVICLCQKHYAEREAQAHELGFKEGIESAESEKEA